MRRLSMGCVVLVAAMIALPASGRAFRTDLFTCTPGVGDNAPQFCWGGDLPSNEKVALPSDNSKVNPDVNPSVPIGFENGSFSLIAFDYAAFLIAIGNPSGISDPVLTQTRGFSRYVSAEPDPFVSGDDPLLRLNWVFDYSNLKNIPAALGYFLPDPNNVEATFGVQVILYGDGSHAIPQTAPGTGYEINGLRNYSLSSSTDGDISWNGAEQPCGSFDNSGVCNVPEPSSVALLGLGFLTLVVGLRTGRPARTRPA